MRISVPNVYIWVYVCCAYILCGMYMACVNVCGHVLCVMCECMLYMCGGACVMCYV